MAAVPVLMLMACLATSSAAVPPAPAQLVKQWASGGSASSQYGAPNCKSPCWGVVDAFGPPNVAKCGDNTNAWAPKTSGDEENWILLTYKQPIYASKVTIYESYSPGFVQKVQLLDTSDKLRDIVYRGFYYGGSADPTFCDPTTSKPRALTVSFPTRDYLVKGVRIWTRKGGYEEIDAVELQGYTKAGAKPPPPPANQLINQYANGATASSTYSSTGQKGTWAPIDAVGMPDIGDGQCGDLRSAWAPKLSGTGGEWLQLSYGTPVFATAVAIHETNIGGFVTKVELIDTNNKYYTVYTGKDTTKCGSWLTVKFSKTAYRVKGVKVSTQANGWEEIDAVRLDGYK